MNAPLSLQLPENWNIIYNSLYDSHEPILLTQDILAIWQKHGHLDVAIVIDVGWYPEHDPDGDYVIRTAYVVGGNLLKESEIVRARDAKTVAAEVERLARKYTIWQPNAAT